MNFQTPSKIKEVPKHINNVTDMLSLHSVYIL